MGGKIIFKKGQATLEYAFLIAVLIGSFLAAQTYIKRSMSGQIQRTSDQIADQYAFGGTDLHEHFHSKVSSTRWDLPGWGAPTEITNSKTHFNSMTDKKVISVLDDPLD